MRESRPELGRGLGSMWRVGGVIHQEEGLCSAPWGPRGTLLAQGRLDVLVTIREEVWVPSQGPH